jgi:hypothetical protein
MLIALPVIIVVTIFKMVAVETPVVDNSRTRYCVANNIYSKGEHKVSAKSTCTRGSMSVQHELPSLAERKSK